MSVFDDENTFSANLRLYRVKAGYTQVELANRLGMTRQNYIRYEARVNTAQPSIKLLCNMAKILNTDVNTLVGYQSTIDVDTAYKMLDVKEHDGDIDYSFTIKVDHRNDAGFDDPPYEKRITITMPKADFDRIISKNYGFAYENAKFLTGTEATERNKLFLQYVESEISNKFLTKLLDDYKG